MNCGRSSSRCCPSRHRSWSRADRGCLIGRPCAASSSSCTPDPGEYLPQGLGFGSGLTCWRRLAAWNEAGVWGQLHLLLLEKLRSKKQLDWSRAVIDSSHVRALRRGPKSGSARSTAHGGRKHHVITDAQGIPLAVTLTGGNRNDVTQLLPVLDEIPAIAGRVGRPRRRPNALLADRGYDHDIYRRLLWQHGIRPVIAKRGEPHGTGLGIFRYVVERTIAWLHDFRRLRIRWERRDDIHEVFLGLAVCVNPSPRSTALLGTVRGRVAS